MAALGRSTALRAVVLLGMVLAGGCATGPSVVPVEEAQPIDRKLVEYPAGFHLVPYIRGLNAPVAMAFDNEGSLLIAENGPDGKHPRIFGYRRDNTYFEVYPRGRNIFGIGRQTLDFHAPIGGMVVAGGRIYVTHRDASGMGVVSAFDYDGNATTIVANLPARGDYSLTDIITRADNRLYFGLGSATNSGVVGLDNWARGWVNRYSDFCDIPFVTLALLGYRADAKNPEAGLFGGDDIAVTGPFQPFGQSDLNRIRRASDGKPTGAIYSVDPSGGDLRVEAHGIRLPRGLAVNEFGRLYATNNGMELRGTRPVKDDPDSLIRIITGAGVPAWYGFPDYSADFQPITDERFQPPIEMLIKTGYRSLSFLIDQYASNPPNGLSRPDRTTLLQATFAPLSGAGKMAVIPSAGPLSEYQGNILVALGGDYAPFATSGHKMIEPTGYKVVRVELDPDRRQVIDFIRNTQGKPASEIGKDVEALERPWDLKFGPDGAVYVLDHGRLEMKGGRERVFRGTGKIFKLIPANAETQPAEEL